MHAQETARYFLRKRWAQRRPTPFIDIRCFGLPLNEKLPDVCRLQSTSSPSGSAAEVCPVPSAAPFSTVDLLDD